MEEQFGCKFTWRGRAGVRQGVEGCPTCLCAFAQGRFNRWDWDKQLRSYIKAAQEISPGGLSEKDSKRRSCAGAARLVASFAVAVTIVLLVISLVHLCHTCHLSVSFYASRSAVHNLSGSSASGAGIRKARHEQCIRCVFIRSSRKTAHTSSVLFPLSDIYNPIYPGLPQSDHFISSYIISSIQSRAPPQGTFLC